jgi:hypothetical protein
MSRSISAGGMPRILIESIAGDLSLVGWDSEEILLKGEDQEMQVEQDGALVKVSCAGDLALRVPRGASASIHRVDGDASIRGIHGAIEFERAGGELSLRDVGAAAIGTVHADLTLRGARGDVSVRKAQGEASIREVEGNLALDSVTDDLALREVRGNVRANVGEDVVLYLVPRPGNAYTISAGEDILLVMPPDADAALTMNADEIDIEWEGIPKEGGAARSVTLGGGSARITLNAGGDIRVSDRPEAGDSVEDFGNFAGIGIDWSDFGERISRRAGQAARRIAKHAEQAARSAERAGRRIDARVNVGRWNWDLFPKGAPMPPKPAVSEEERMTILRMLQEKKITADEADKLLAALESEG